MLLRLGFWVTGEFYADQQTTEAGDHAAVPLEEQPSPTPVLVEERDLGRYEKEIQKHLLGDENKWGAKRQSGFTGRRAIYEKIEHINVSINNEKKVFRGEVAVAVAGKIAETEAEEIYKDISGQFWGAWGEEFMHTSVPVTAERFSS